jgi:hypothetical protein
MSGGALRPRTSWEGAAGLDEPPVALYEGQPSPAASKPPRVPGVGQREHDGDDRVGDVGVDNRLVDMVGLRGMRTA